VSEQRLTTTNDPLVALANDLRTDARSLALATRAAGRRWRLIHYWLGGPASIAAAVAGVSAIQSNATIAAGLALVSAVLMGLSTWLNPGDTAANFLQTSRRYAAVSARISTLLRLEINAANGDRQRKGVKARLVELQEELHHIRDRSPEVPEWAFYAKERQYLRMIRVGDPPKRRLALKVEVLGSGDTEFLRQLRD